MVNGYSAIAVTKLNIFDTLKGAYGGFYFGAVRAGDGLTGPSADGGCSWGPVKAFCSARPGSEAYDSTMRLIFPRSVSLIIGLP